MGSLENSLTYRGYGIVKDSENKEIIDKLKNDLYVKLSCIMNMGPAKSEPKGFKVYIESSKKLYIPKHYGLQHFGLPQTTSISEGEDMHKDVEFKGSLRENQMKPVNTYLEYAKDPKHMGGILQLPPGWGKTVMALYLACFLNKKTIVVVHKDFLLKQWQERIEQYVPNARIGIIKQSKMITENCDIILASLQTLCLRDFRDDTIGMVIIDECHHMGAQVFSQAFHKLNVKYSLGLSATVNRVDGLTKVFKWFLGDVVFKAKRPKDEQKGLQVRVINYINSDQGYCFEHTLYNGKPNIAKMLNNICSYLPRTDVIVQEIANILKKDTNRNVLVLSDRRGHLEDILESLCNHGFSKSELGYYVGGMKNEDLLESETKQIILGTYNMVSEGFDLPKLDTLIMASPKSNVEQSVGRIQRKLITDREYAPLVIDIVDGFSVFKNQAKKRCAFYKKSGFCVEGGLDFERNKDTFELTGKSFFMNEED
jgi:superfamily II DNA or RNA helicase